MTHEEGAIDGRTRHLRFDIDLLARRLADATNWAMEFAETKHLHIGYFGASTAAAVALVAAAEIGAKIGPVVSRGGRPDMAGETLTRVISPTLLLVGGLQDSRWGCKIDFIGSCEETVCGLICVFSATPVRNISHIYVEAPKNNGLVCGTSFAPFC